MPTIAERLGCRRIVFVGGKGGVGKTTLAAALAVDAADRGRSCLLVSTDPAHSLGDVFGRDVGDTERTLTEGLSALEIDPDRTAARHIAGVKQQVKALVHPRMYDEVDRQLDLARSAPGTVEAALFERVADVMGQAGEHTDLVVFDTAPTGHTLRLLALPEVMAAWTDGLLRHRARASRLGEMLGRFGGAPATAPGESDDRAERLRQLLLVRRRKLARARELLLDKEASAFILVLNPDKLSILESRKAASSLEAAQVAVTAVVVNRVLPASASGDADGFFTARRRQEAPYLREIDDVFGRWPRYRVPLFTTDVHGIAALRELGRRLGDATF